MDNNKSNRQQQGGTGSAEQTGRDRQEQKQSVGQLNENEKAEGASGIGEEENNISTLSDLGLFSGRDDAAGGSGERMEEENTN